MIQLQLSLHDLISVQFYSYVTSLEFRGVWCDLFEFTDGSGMLYYQRAESEMPVRSTNQAEDPG